MTIKETIKAVLWLTAIAAVTVLAMKALTIASCMAEITAVRKFVASNPTFFSLLMLAAINTMPPSPPAPFDRVAWINWSWTWLHDATKTFVSFRGPARQDK